MYIATDVLLIIRKVQIINPKNFAKTTLDLHKKVFVVHIATITLEIAIYSACQAQIALLKTKKVSISVLKEYLDYADFSFKKLAIVLTKHTEINIYTINLEESKQPPYKSIYSFGPVELKTVKIYIEINLINNFI